MLDSLIEPRNLIFGAAGTQTSVAAAGTNTSSPYPMSSDTYSLQITAIATGTSGVGGTVVLQASNDNSAWFALGSATCTATQAGTSTTYAAGALLISNSPFAYARTIVGATGTGSVVPLLAM